jgi:sec-independent protein translocase protein TatA
MLTLLGFIEGLFSPTHMIILLIIGILIFGKRLPEMGRYLGKGIVEFKKGMKGLEDEVEGTVTSRAEPPPAIEQLRPPQRVATTAPKFEDNAGAITTPPKV